MKSKDDALTMSPREGEVYRHTSSGNEVLIDHVTQERVLVRLTDGRGGLLSARSLALADWERIRESHGLLLAESGLP